MLYREVAPGVFQPWQGELIDDVRHPRAIEQLWTDAALAAIHLYRPAASQPVPAGKRRTGTVVERVSGVVRFVDVLEDVPLGEAVETASAAIVAMADAITRPVLQAYPEGERALWTVKEAEARAFLALEDKTPSAAPLINAVCQAQHGDSDDAARVEQITDKANTIVAKADAWYGLSAYVEGFRSRYDVLIAAASNAAEVEGVLDQARDEAASVPAVGA